MDKTIKRVWITLLAAIAFSIAAVCLFGSMSISFAINDDLSGYDMVVSENVTVTDSDDTDKLLRQDMYLSTSDYLYNQFGENKYNHLVLVWGRSDMIEYLRSMYKIGINTFVDEISLKNDFFKYSGSHTMEPAYAFAELKNLDNTGTLDYIEFGKNDAYYIGNYIGTFDARYNMATKYYGENEEIYDVGFFGVYYYSTIFNCDIRGLSDVGISSFNEHYESVSAGVTDKNTLERYEKVLGVHREGDTTITVNYLAMTGFNTYVNRSYETTIASYLVPNKAAVKKQILTDYGANENGISAFNAVYTPTTAFLMSNGKYTTVDVFGEKIIRAANDFEIDYDGGQIPDKLNVSVVYNDYSYKDFGIQIRNNNADAPNYLYLDFYPTKTEIVSGVLKLYFDYEKIFDLFNTTFNWSGYPSAFSVSVPSDYPSEVTIAEAATGRKGTDPDGKEFDYKQLIVSVNQNKQESLFGISISGTANITEPVELDCVLSYKTINSDLSGKEATLPLGKHYDNTIGNLKAELADKNGAYKNQIYGGLNAEVLGGTEYMKVKNIECSVDYSAKTATFYVEYDYNTVFVFRNKATSAIIAVRLVSNCTIQNLNIPVPEGYRIKKISDDNTNRVTMIVNQENPQKNELRYNGYKNVQDPIYFDVEFTDEWNLQINYLTQYKKSPFAVMNTTTKSIKLNDYPDIYSLTPENIAEILDRDVKVLQLKQTAVQIDTVTVDFNLVDTYVVKLDYSVITVVTKDSSGNNDYLNVKLTPFSMWRESFGEDWTLTYLASDVFQFSNEVAYDKLYGLFSVAVFKEQVKDFNSWFKDLSGAGCSVIFNKSEIRGSDFYKFVRKNETALTLLGGAIGAFAGLFCASPIKGAIIGAAAGKLFSFSSELISEMAHDDYGTYYSYFFYLDGTTDKPFIAHNGADDIDDDGSAFGNWFENKWEEIGGSKILKILGIVLGVILVVFVLSFALRILEWVFPNGRQSKKRKGDKK